MRSGGNAVYSCVVQTQRRYFTVTVRRSDVTARTWYDAVVTATMPYRLLRVLSRRRTVTLGQTVTLTTGFVRRYHIRRQCPCPCQCLCPCLQSSHDMIPVNWTVDVVSNDK